MRLCVACLCLAFLACLPALYGCVSPVLRLSQQRRMSVCEIVTNELYDRGKPKPGGLSDPRLGTLDRTIKCASCAGSMAECPGHFGHFELARPVFHNGFIKTILAVLRCVCHNCSRLLASEVSLKENDFRGLHARASVSFHFSYLG
jgi:DNA-directed RNA polymerase beta' subunit